MASELGASAPESHPRVRSRGRPTDSGEQPGQAPTWLKATGLAVLLLGGYLLARHLGLFEPGFRDQLLALLRSLGPWAPLAFVAIKIGTVVFALPSAPVTFTGGLLFGVVGGTVINVLAATAGASITFFVGRSIGREAVEKRLSGRLKELDEGLAANGLSFMLFLRLVPLFPFNGINYGAGLTRVSFRDYLLGTFFGIMPGAAVFTYIGAAAAEGSPTKALLGLGALGLLALLPTLFWKKSGGGTTPHAPTISGEANPNDV